MGLFANKRWAMLTSKKCAIVLNKKIMCNISFGKKIRNYLGPDFVMVLSSYENSKIGGERMNKKKEVLKLAERIARLRVEGDSYRWPPICAGILHQPKRPKAINRTE